MKPQHFLIFVFFLFFTGATFGQRSEISLTFTGRANGSYAQLDSVRIHNLDRNCDTTLRWPDTVFTKFNVGIGNLTKESGGLEVYQNTPNPVITSTSVRVYVAKQGLVKIQVADIQGNIHTSLEKQLTPGFHIFLLIPGSEKTYLFTAIQYKMKQTIKIAVSGNSSSSKCLVAYLGEGDEKRTTKPSSILNLFPWALKDNLKITGYHNGITATLTDAPEGSKTDTLTFSVFTCNALLMVNHVAGAVAPVSKIVTYTAISNIPGEPAKCWITSNLGSDHQATASDDVTEPSAGWYWQFNRKQGYMHDGVTRTPNTIWDLSKNEPQYWLSANDPCALELGNGWRVPTHSEWFNVDAAGFWTDPVGPWNSPLRLHAAGSLNASNGKLISRGTYGFYWSSTSQWYIDDYCGMYFVFYPGHSYVDYNYKGFGFSVRCVRE
ncbi:MAG: hypothetical protein ACOYNC_07015 [Bacteroidales bacterium]